jgi:hypothetical protein
MSERKGWSLSLVIPNTTHATLMSRTNMGQLSIEEEEAKAKVIWLAKV